MRGGTRWTPRMPAAWCPPGVAEAGMCVCVFVCGKLGGCRSEFQGGIGICGKFVVGLAQVHCAMLHQENQHGRALLQICTPSVCTLGRDLISKACLIHTHILLTHPVMVCLVLDRLPCPCLPRPPFCRGHGPPRRVAPARGTRHTWVNAPRAYAKRMPCAGARNLQHAAHNTSWDTDKQQQLGATWPSRVCAKTTTDVFASVHEAAGVHVP